MMRWYPLLLALALLALYGPHLLSAGWVWEDAGWQSAITAPVSLGPARSLTVATWHLTPTPMTAHLFSLGLHLSVVALLGLLAWRLGYTGRAAWLVAGLMALHRLTVETVAYAAARTELVAAIGVLVAVVCAAGRWGRMWPLRAAGIGVGLIGAWAGKESGIVALALVPLTLLVRVRRPILVGVCTLALVSTLIIVDVPMVQRLANIGESGALEDVQWGPWALTQATAAWRLVGLAVVPIGLTVDPDLDIVPVSMRWLSVAGLGLMAILALSVARQRPLVTYGLLWCLACLIPRLVVQTPRSYLNDHQFYLPLMGLILAGVAWWDSG